MDHQSPSNKRYPRSHDLTIEKAAEFLLDQMAENQGVVTFYDLYKLGWETWYIHDAIEAVKRILTAQRSGNSVISVWGIGYAIGFMSPSITPERTYSLLKSLTLHRLKTALLEDIENRNVEYYPKQIGNIIGVKVIKLNGVESYFPNPSGQPYEVFALQDLKGRRDLLILTSLEGKFLELMLSNQGYIDRSIWIQANGNPEPNVINLAARGLNKKLRKSKIFRKTKMNLIQSGLAGYYLINAVRRLQYLDTVSQNCRKTFAMPGVTIEMVMLNQLPIIVPATFRGNEAFFVVHTLDKRIMFEASGMEAKILQEFINRNSLAISALSLEGDVNFRTVFNNAFKALVAKLVSMGAIEDKSYISKIKDTQLMSDGKRRIAQCNLYHFPFWRYDTEEA